MVCRATKVGPVLPHLTSDRTCKGDDRVRHNNRTEESSCHLKFYRRILVSVACNYPNWLAVAATAETRAKADVACQPATKKLQYDCVIKLMDTRTEQPLSGVDLMVGADMPSMPMAHNVRPVKAAAGENPDTYQARIQLEKLGDWALRLDLAGPVRDRVIKVLRFEKDRVSPQSATVTPSPRR